MRDVDMNKRGRQLIAPAVMIGLATCGAAWADEAFADEQTPATEAPASTPPAPPTLLPAMSGPLAANSKPNSYDAGPLGNVYVTGIVSGFAQWQNNVAPGDRSHQADVSNAQIFLNKPTGLVQYFIQAGAYSLPDIGTPYIRAGKSTNAFYEPSSQGYIKLAPNDNFSIMAGTSPPPHQAAYTLHLSLSPSHYPPPHTH